MTINAGRLRHRITIVAQSLVPDENGEVKKEYNPVSPSIPCEVKKESGSTEGDTDTTTDLNIKVRMRKRDIPRDYMIQFKGEIYEIIYIDQPINNTEQLVYAKGKL